MGWMAKLLALAVRWALAHPDTIKAGIDLIEKGKSKTAADGPKA